MSKFGGHFQGRYSRSDPRGTFSRGIYHSVARVAGAYLGGHFGAIDSERHFGGIFSAAAVKGHLRANTPDYPQSRLPLPSITKAGSASRLSIYSS